MKKIFLILLILCSCSRETDLKSVATQVRGEGCSYDEECGSHWSWWKQISTRAPEYRCRMKAAQCLAKKGSLAKAHISDLKVARTEMPETFDTGDGIIKYSACIDTVVKTIEGVVDTSPESYYACQS